MTPADHEALAAWRDELARRADPVAAAHAARERGRAAIIQRGNEWSAQARAYEKEHAPKKTRNMGSASGHAPA